MENALDFQDEVCYTDENHIDTEREGDDKDTFYLPRQHMP